jgi:hypothetical protein
MEEQPKHEHIHLYKRKMTRLTAILFLLLLLSGCTWMFFDNYQNFDDEFKNNSKIIARILLDTEERRTEINSAYVIFEREVSANQDIVKAYFVIARSTSSFKIENKGFLKADNQSFEIDVINPVTEHKSKNETSVQTFTKVDSTGVYSGQSTDIDESLWTDDKFMFTLSPEMISRIKSSNELILRFYFGPIPATFRFRRSDLKTLHRLLNEEVLQ